MVSGEKDTSTGMVSALALLRLVISETGKTGLLNFLHPGGGVAR